jgi:hypothetical protein
VEKKLKRFCSLFLALVLLAAPAAIGGEALTLAGSAARTAPGFGSAIDVGNLRQVFVVVNVTAGSGTVSSFRAWIESSVDGTTFAEVVCDLIVKAGAAPPGSVPSARRDIVNEAAVVTSAIYSATCAVSGRQIRARWDVTGTTPSETFSVMAFVK